MTRLKNCTTCAHSKRHLMGEEFRYCLLARSFCDRVRRWESKVCDKDFSGYVEKKSMFQRISELIEKKG